MKYKGNGNATQLIRPKAKQGQRSKQYTYKTKVERIPRKGGIRIGYAKKGETWKCENCQFRGNHTSDYQCTRCRYAHYPYYPSSP